jgi:hypothetical protein
MPISGLVVTLTDNPVLQQAALAAMRDNPALELGERRYNQIALVVESAGEEEDRLIWEWLHALPGVAMVVVAFIHFDDEPGDGSDSQVDVIHDSSFSALDRKL